MFALCPSTASNDCTATYHLPCLATHFLACTPHNLLPKTGTCPACAAPLEWGAVIRGCYARRDGVLEGSLAVEREAQRLQRRENAAKRRRERAAQDETDPAAQVEDEEADEESSRGQGEDEDDDDELMRSMVRGQAESDGSDDAPCVGPPVRKAKKPAARPRATVRRARNGKKLTTGRTQEQAGSVSLDGSVSESEGTRLEREMMAIVDAP